MNHSRFYQLYLTILFASMLILTGCLGFGVKVKPKDTVDVPYIKNSANECYYLDEFMPTPDSMVTGRTGTLSLRYYSYKAASYKDWGEKNHVILSFYSHDSRCWSLFEEYFVDY